MYQLFYQPLGLSELLPRYAFLEDLLPRARVLEDGAVTATLGRSAAFLRERGARSVLALDRGEGPVAAARREYASDPELRFLAQAPEDLDEGPFDLVLVADATAALREPARLSALVRATAPGGFAVFALRNPAGLSLAAVAAEEPAGSMPPSGELFAALVERFPSVERVAQTALLGYRLAKVPGEHELSVDGSLAEAEECAYWLAVCGQRACGLLSSHCLVALPPTPLAHSLGQRAELGERLRRAERDAPGGDRDRLERDALEARLARFRVEIDAARRGAAEDRVAARASDARATAAEVDWRGGAERATAWETELAGLEREARAPAPGPGVSERETALAGQLESAQAQGRRLAALLETERQRVARAEAEAAVSAARVQAAREALEAESARAGRLEKDVATVSALERSARQRAERFADELVRLGATPPGPEAKGGAPESAP